nr:GIY-YIG nuclease family protein [Winogradskyella algicola]
MYIFSNVDSSYYTGITSNLPKRILEHTTGKHLDS